MICGTGIHDQLPDFFHDLWHWNPRSAPSTCRSQQRACPTCPRTATAEHHSFLHVWTTSEPAQQDIGHLVKKTARQRACQPPCPRTGQQKATTCTTRSSTTFTNCNCGTATGTSTTLSKNCKTPPPHHPRPPHHPGTHFGAPGRRPRRCNNDHHIALYRALGSAGAWVTLPKEATPDGQALRATTPKGVSPIIGLVALHLQTLGPPATVTPGWLLVSPVRCES